MGAVENVRDFTKIEGELFQYYDAVIAEMDKKALYKAGLEDGIRQGLQEEYQQGFQLGLPEGRQAARRDVARKMLFGQFTMAQIISVTGLSEAEVLELAKTNGAAMPQ